MVRILDIDRQILEEYKAKKESWQKCLESGSTYYNLKEYEKAIADCTKAIEHNPDYALAYNIRGLAYRNLKEYKKAIADYTKVIELNPNVDKDYYDPNRKLVHIILTILMFADRKLVHIILTILMLAIIVAFFTVR